MEIQIGHIGRFKDNRWTKRLTTNKMASKLRKAEMKKKETKMADDLISHLGITRTRGAQD